MATGERLWHGAPMPSTARAGGCFLPILILGGFAAGLAFGNIMAGVLIGTAAGVTLAILTWLLDRRRER